MEVIRTEKMRILSTEAEYIALLELCAELLFIWMIFKCLGEKINYPIVLCCGNVGGSLAHNTKTRHRTKHIDTRFYFVREYVEDSILKILFVKSAKNQADTFTKNVGEESFNKNAGKYQK